HGGEQAAVYRRNAIKGLAVARGGALAVDEGAAVESQVGHGTGFRVVASRDAKQAHATPESRDPPYPISLTCHDPSAATRKKATGRSEAPVERLLSCATPPQSPARACASRAPPT